MMDFYNQSGHLPTESMTGNHAIDIIVDAYRKGFKGIDSLELYQAMKKQILIGPFIQKDMKAYLTNGQFHRRTLNLSQGLLNMLMMIGRWLNFLKKVMSNKLDYDSLKVLSNTYKNLFYADSMFLLPRDGNQFLKTPAPWL